MSSVLVQIIRVWVEHEHLMQRHPDPQFLALHLAVHLCSSLQLLAPFEGLEDPSKN